MSLGLSFSISWLGFLQGHISGSSGTCLAAHIHAGFSLTRAGLGLSLGPPGGFEWLGLGQASGREGLGSLCSSPGGSDGSHRK